MNIEHSFNVKILDSNDNVYYIVDSVAHGFFSYKLYLMVGWLGFYDISTSVALFNAKSIFYANSHFYFKQFSLA